MMSDDDVRRLTETLINMDKQLAVQGTDLRHVTETLKSLTDGKAALCQLHSADISYIKESLASMKASQVRQHAEDVQRRSGDMKTRRDDRLFDAKAHKVERESDSSNTSTLKGSIAWGKVRAAGWPAIIVAAAVALVIAVGGIVYLVDTVAVSAAKQATYDALRSLKHGAGQDKAPLANGKAVE